ncbi:PKD domain-containing protein [Tersicoccus sp. MR15.9]|uniref:PKD domain-containing protein n=1 Tax=Tersicoccus mangrovi TaxID=3121635 RepID=UPI002FE6B61C
MTTLATVALFGSISTGAMPTAVAATPDYTATVTADALPTVQIDGVAWTQKIVGKWVYVGGSFANARPAGAAAGTNLTARQNLLRYDLATGTLDAGWNPGANSDVRDIDVSPDGSRIYVAGLFTSVAGQARNRVAAFDAATGALISTWKPDVNARADTVAATADTVYIGGEFTAVNGAQRAKVAAVSASSGATLPFSAAVVGGYGVKGLEIAPDRSKIVIDGSFTSVNGSTNPGRGMAALDARTGASLPWAVNSVIRNAGGNAAMMSLSSDGDSVYGTAFDYGGTAEDGFEGAFRASWADGTLIWMEDCHGDTYSVAPVGDSVYIASHSHYCGNIGGFPQTNPWQFHHSLSFSKDATGPAITPDPLGYRSFTGEPSPTLQQWFPNWVVGSYTGQSQAVWNVTGNADYVVYGGEFPKVNNTAQQGLVRFARTGLAPNKMGPQTQGGAWAVTASSNRPTEARVSWQANSDQDSRTLHYQVLRKDLATPVWEGDQDSTFWNKPAMQYRDTRVTAGQTYSYRVKVLDPNGNWTQSDWTSVTVATTGAATTAYDSAVMADNPTDYWPMNESSGSAAYDWSGSNDLVVNGATRGATGPNLKEPTTATTFAGSSDSFAATGTPVTGPQTFSVEAWIRTSSTAGGKIVGFGDLNSGNSNSYDRHVYMDGSGRITFGVYPGTVRALTSAPGFNDNAWHQIVASLGPDGQTLWIDGRRVGADPGTTSAQGYTGYWRVGGDNLNGWPNVAGTAFQGDIADVAVYPTPLTRDQIDNHRVQSGRPSTTPTAPTDAYGARVFKDNPDLYWRLGEADGTTAADSGPNGNPGVYSGSGLTFGQGGAITGTSNTAVGFDGSSGELGSASTWTNPTTYSLETWFRTGTTVGGKLIGFGSSQSGNSGSYDRHVYMQDDGRLVFGVWTGQTNTITTPDPLNDNQWHHVVATQGADGMKLYIDGQLTGTNPQTQAQDYAGYWRVGNDTTWGSSSSHFNGTLDDVAVYSSVLSAATVGSHYQLGTGTTPNQAPTAAFTSSANNLALSVDGSDSSDPDGSIASYAWDFGDGGNATGATANHTYTTAGTYTVKLTVTDNRNATGSVTKQVTVAAANQLPTAAFTSSVSNLALSVDGSGSSDPDGSIASYAWDFGDGGNATGATANHTYTTAGTYTVGLTVTDDRGGTNTTTKQVSVTAPPADIIAKDLFDRTVTGGWGTATTGGPWALQGGNAAFSVANSAGQVSLNKGDTRAARLTSVTSTVAETTAEFSVDRTGAGFSWTLIGRQVGSDLYSARIKFEANGVARLYILHGETALANSYVLPGVTYAAGDRLMVKLRVAGTSPTTVSAKAWRSGTTEPTGWQATGTDATAAMQQAGTVGLTQYLSTASVTDTASTRLLTYVITNK